MRDSLLPAVLAAFVVLVSAAAAQLAPAKPRGDGQRPNVLFIAVDDLRPELGCYGSPAVTPHLDRLAASGLQFDRAYCNQAVCGASRVSLMTGLYPERTGERTYHVTGWRKRWKDIVTLNQHFNTNGYTTVGLGKIYHGSGGPGVDPEHWTAWLKAGGREYGDPESLKNARERNGRRRGPSTEAANVPDDSHFDGNRAKIGAARIHQLAKAQKPFFLAVGFTKPHLPFTAPKRYWDLYRRDSFSLPPNLSVPPGYPDYARNRMAGELRAYSDIPRRGTPGEFPDELNKRLLHGYYACVSYVDRNVGVLFDALEKSGVAQNTIIVFWADHGWKLGDHSSWCKHTNFECDTRVPLIIRHPKMPSARGRTKALAELIDLYPTLCDLAGLEKPQHLQGQSLVPVLEDPESSHREFAYSSYPHGNKTGHSIRTADYRYTEWWEKGSDRVIDRALTNLAKDPAETTSALPAKSEHADDLSKKLRARVLKVRKP